MAPTSDSSSNSDSNSQSQKDQSSPSNDSSSSSASDNQNNGGSSDNNNGGNSDNNNGGNSDNSGGGDSNNNDGNSNNNNNNNGGNSNNSNNGGNSNNDNNGGNSDNNNNNGGNSDNNGGKSDSNNNGGNSDNNNNGGNSNNNNNGGNSDNNNNGGNSNNNNNGGNSNNNNNGGNSNNNNNGGNSNNNNNGGNSNNDNNSSSQSSSNSSQGNWSPPKSSNGKWSPPPALGSSNKSPATSLDTSNDSSPPSRSNSNSTTPLIVGVVAAAGILLLLMILLCLACSKKKKKRRMHHENNPIGGGSDYWQSGPYKSNEHVMNMPPPHGGWQSGHAPPAMMSSDMSSAYNSGPHGPALPPPHPSVALGFNKSTFSYEELAVATSGFAQAKLLGQGGFGYVHKGVLPNGKEIAVKSLKAGSGQGDREFAAEVEIISRVHHRHLVSLVGYCLSGERKLLVYEFVPNNNLEFHLHGKGRPPLDWASRIKIALGSAKGLAYLHEDCHPKIIHRDIKTANILIDDNFEAKVADFGLAKLNEANETHVSTRIMGTFGYLAPEYASSGKLTEKSDVFSFGIMLLELITGRRPIDTTGDYEEDTLVDWARPLCQRAIEDGNFSELADPRLEKNYNPEEMARMIACAAASTRQAGRKRPKMSQIVRALEGDVSMEDLSEGIKPGQRGFFGSSGTSSEFDRDSYNENMKQFRKTALNDSTDYPSSEYGATSSDHSQEIERKAGASRMDSPA